MGQSESMPTSGRLTSDLQHFVPTDAHPDITYTPLTDPRSFRILRLRLQFMKATAGWQNLALHGSIIEASLDNVPDYFALSYTWGDPSLSDRICIDGRMLGITQNCADALRRMLKGKLKRMIWVDSICINQAGTFSHGVSNVPKHRR